jgi:hypothetical protein
MLYCRCIEALLVISLTCLNEFPGRDKTSTADEQAVQKVKDSHADLMMSCAKACSDCQRACDMCSAHCVAMLTEGKTQHTKTMQLCNDCATVCAASAQIVARHGPLLNVICTACADACNQCAKACETEKDDAHMKHCAEQCRLCEKACRTMTGQAVQRGR